MCRSHTASESPKSSKSNRVICSRAACTEQRFLLPPWKYNSLKVAICACTRICYYMTATYDKFQAACTCASVCTRLNRNAFLQRRPAELCIFKGASFGLWGWAWFFMLREMCLNLWMKSYHRSTWGAKLGNRAGEICQRGQDAVRVQWVYDQVVNALWCSLSWRYLAPSPSWSSLLIILPADGILKSDLGFSVTNLPGSHEKMLSIQETLTLRDKRQKSRFWSIYQK